MRSSPAHLVNIRPDSPPSDASPGRRFRALVQGRCPGGPDPQTVTSSPPCRRADSGVAETFRLAFNMSTTDAVLLDAREPVWLRERIG